VNGVRAPAMKALQTIEIDGGVEIVVMTRWQSLEETTVSPSPGLV
jgi:hypothetical protein